MLNTAQPLDPKLCVLTARQSLLKKKLLGKATQTELQREKKMIGNTSLYTYSYIYKVIQSLTKIIFVIIWTWTDRWIRFGSSRRVQWTEDVALKLLNTSPQRFAPQMRSDRSSSKIQHGLCPLPREHIRCSALLRSLASYRQSIRCSENLYVLGGRNKRSSMCFGEQVSVDRASSYGTRIRLVLCVWISQLLYAGD